MKIFKRSFISLLILTSALLFAVGTDSSSLIAKDKVNNEIVNTKEAVEIVELEASSANGLNVCNFKIKSLPSSESGVLYMEDGTTIHVGQNLTYQDAEGLKFDPKETFVGDAVFTYSAMDVYGNEGPVGTITLPIVAPEETPDTPTVTVITDDKLNPKMRNSLPAVNILDLSGKDENDVAVSRFIIKTLPIVKSGMLYMSDGKTAVIVDQILTKDESDGLKFDPKEKFVGDAQFTYQAIDANDNYGNIATVTIPIVDGNKTHNNSGGVCKDYNESVPTMNLIGVLLMIVLSIFLGLSCMRDELA